MLICSPNFCIGQKVYLADLDGLTLPAHREKFLAHIGTTREGIVRHLYCENNILRAHVFWHVNRIHYAVNVPTICLTAYAPENTT